MAAVPVQFSKTVFPAWISRRVALQLFVFQPRYVGSVATCARVGHNADASAARPRSPAGRHLFCLEPLPVKSVLGPWKSDSQIE